MNHLKGAASAVPFGLDDGMGNLVGVEEGSFTVSETGHTPAAKTDGTGVSYTYDATTKRLATIVTESSTYTFTYDLFGNTESIGVGDRTLASYTYHANNGKLETLTYGNGDMVKYVYDALDRVKEIWYNTGEDGAWARHYSYQYTASGALDKVHDHGSGDTTAYVYDALGKPICTYVYAENSSDIEFREDTVYDDEDRVTNVLYLFPYYYDDQDMLAGTVNYSASRTYTYDEDTGDMTEASLTAGNLSFNSTMIYDVLHRLVQRNGSYTVDGTTSIQLVETYEYANLTEALRTSSRIARCIRFMEMDGTEVTAGVYDYTYDANGNITEIYEFGTMTYRYEYDDLGQLIREDNRPMNKTFLYYYDAAGNRTGVSSYAYTTGAIDASNPNNAWFEDATWGDLLAYYNYISYAYDEIGNVTEMAKSTGYTGHFTWKGRQLTSYVYDVIYDPEEQEEPIVIKTASFTYNDEGIRISKTVDGVRHEYILSGSTVIAEKWTENNLEHMLVYVYDDDGSPMAIQYRNTRYLEGEYDVFFLEKNMFGDVIGIYNEDGVKIGGYVYDAWGNFQLLGSQTATTLESKIVSTYNPFRYRSYFYDVDLGFYYLQSRYYSPEIGRFISADGYVSTGQGLLGNNMFAYCNNNPIMNTDPTGESALAILAILAITTAVGGILGYFSDVELGATDETPKSITENTDGGEGTEEQGLTVGQKVKNVVLGAGMGLAVGGAIVATGGVAWGAIKGASAAYLGVTAAQGFAVGALAFDFSALCIMPLFGIEMDPIEYEASTSVPTTKVSPY